MSRRRGSYVGPRSPYAALALSHKNRRVVIVGDDDGDGFFWAAVFGVLGLLGIAFLAYGGRESW